MLSKDDLIKKLRANPMYREALRMARNDDERRRIIATTEGFLSSFVDSFSPIVNRAGNDPAFASQLQEAMKSGAKVVRESDGSTIASGSSGR